MEKLIGRTRAAMSIAVAFLAQALAQETHLEPFSVPETMRVGYSGELSVDVSEEDVHVAVELWAKQITFHAGRRVSPQIDFYPDVDQIEKAILQRRVDMVVLSALNFLELSKRLRLEPSLVAVVEGQVSLGHLLLARKDRAYGGIERLRNSSLIEASRRSGVTVPAMWLQALLTDHGLGAVDSFFATTTTVGRTAQAVLPVFFGQADVALVRRAGYETMCALNPQLERDLEVLAASPRFLPTVTCFPADVEPDKKRTITEGALALHSHPRGRQILTLFGNDRVVRFEESQLASTLDLVAKYHSVGERSKDRR